MPTNPSKLAADLIVQKNYDAVLHLVLREPNNHDVIYCAGLAYDSLGNQEAAIRCWRKCLSLKQDPEVLRALAYTYCEKTDTLTAAADCLELLDESDDIESKDMTLLANIYMQQKQYEAANDCFISAIELDPDNKEAYCGAAILHARIALNNLYQAKKAGLIRDEMPQCDSDIHSLLLNVV